MGAFEMLIHGIAADLAAEAAGPRAREVATELAKFADKALSPFAAAYYRLSETASYHVQQLCPEFENR